jgi:hypothetical protein
MSVDPDMIISDPAAATPTSEVDIAISPTILCNTVAANDATLTPTTTFGLRWQ